MVNGPQKTIDTVKKGLYQDISIRVFIGDKNLNLFKKCTMEMEKDIMDGMNDDDVNIEEENVSKIIETLNFLMRRILISPVKNSVREFINSYCNLAMNWNKLSCNDVINETIDAVLIHMEYHLTVVETTKHLKYLLDEMKKYREFAPPAFELSRHFMNSIEEDLN